MSSDMDTGLRQLEGRVDLAVALYEINVIRYAPSILASTSAVLALDQRNARARKLAALTHFALARRAIESDAWADAAKSLRQSFALDPLDVTIEMFESCAERTGGLRDVVAACEERVRAEPADLRSLFVLGRICVKLAGEGKDDREQLLLRAETALNRVLEFTPNQVEAWYWLGSAFVVAGRHRNARDIVEVLKPLSPGRSQDLKGQLRGLQD